MTIYYLYVLKVFAVIQVLNNIMVLKYNIKKQI